MRNAKELDPASLKKYHDGIQSLDTLLANKEFAAGTKHLTVADLVLVASVSAIDVSYLSLSL